MLQYIDNIHKKTKNIFHLDLMRISMLNSNNQFKNAIISMFPDLESFFQFEIDNSTNKKESVQAIINWSYEQGLIGKNSRLEFINYLKLNQIQEKPPLPENISFKSFMDDMTTNTSTNSLISLMNNFAKEFKMPQIQASMITRLKKDYVINTSKKRMAIRLLAFWFGRKRTELGLNYETLLLLRNEKEEQIEKQIEKEGAVILFHLEGRGDMIDLESVNWLKNELPICINDLKLNRYVTKRNIEEVGVTALKLKFSKKPGHSGEPDLYSVAVRDGIAIGHQLGVRWLLSKHSSTQKVLKVIIYAGKFSQADLAFQPLMNQRIPDDPTIILTDFAKLCADVADVKAVFHRHILPHNINIWIVKYLWVWTYYDYIPVLLENHMLPKNIKDVTQFKQELYFPASVASKQFGALAAIDNSPNSILLMLEIAKVLMARRMYNEADHILGFILRIDNLNLVARVARMMVYSNIAIESTDINLALMAFDRAIKEGEYIGKFSVHDEEYWIEFGRVYFKKALYFIRCSFKDKRQDNLSEILQSIDKSIELFTTGMTVSSSGKDNRNLFYLLYIQALKGIYTFQFTNKKGIDLNTKDEKNIFYSVGDKIFQLVGFKAVETSTEQYEKDNIELLPDQHQKNIMKSMILSLETYLNSILCRTHLCNSKLSLAALLWDFSPYITVGIYKRILSLLQEAKDGISPFLSNKLAIYSFATEQYQSVEEFCSSIDNIQKKLSKIVQTSIFQKNDNELIDELDAPMRHKEKLFLWWFLDEPEKGLYLNN